MIANHDEIMERIKYWVVGGGGRQSLSAEDITRFEETIGFALPGDYRAFVTKYGGTAGGGHTCYSTDDDPDEADASVEVFYDLNPNGMYDLAGIRESFGDDVPRHLLPIASSPGGQIILSLSGEDRGQVYWWSPHRGSSEFYDDLIPISRTFDGFLCSLSLRE